MFEHTDTLAILAALHSLLIKLPVLVGPTSDLSTTTVLQCPCFICHSNSLMLFDHLKFPACTITLQSITKYCYT